MTTSARCKDCRFAVAVATIDPDTQKAVVSKVDGFCYRFPPTMVPPASASYPPIALDRFWCGEFERGPTTTTTKGRKQ